MDTQDDASIQDFDWCYAYLGIKHTQFLYSYLQVNIKVASYTMKLIADY